MTLGQLFDDVRHQKLAVGIPCHPDYRKQEDEILTHLAKLTRDKRNDMRNDFEEWFCFNFSSKHINLPLAAGTVDFCSVM